MTLVRDLTVAEWDEGRRVPLDRPVVVRGGAAAWPVMTLTFDRLASVAGAVEVRVTRVSGAATSVMPLGEFLAYCRTAADADPWYLRDWHYRRTHPEWDAAMPVPVAFDNWMDALPEVSRPDWRWFYIGPAGSGTPFHHDTQRSSAWNVVIDGAKAWEAIPPDAPDARVTWAQGAGDLVCVPSGWVHRVENTRPTIACSGNFINASNVETVLSALDDSRDGMRRAVKFARALRGA